MWWHVLLHAFLDTLKIFPFILIIYVIIELIEHKTSLTKNGQLLQGKLAPLIGTATGIIPQCGFSVMAAKLYDRGLIKTGTLLAVFLATSDEALILLLADFNAAPSVMPLVLIKFIVAVGVGYLANLLLPEEKEVEPLSVEDINGYSCGREHHGSNLKVYFLEPLLHSLKIALYLFIVNLIFGFIVEAVGEAQISSLIEDGSYFEPFIVSLVGLIPNCASSVIITQVYIQGGITFGSCVAGLCANAGLGFMVLLKNTKKLKRNILLILSVYFISALVGFLVNAGMSLFNLI
ncbi:MAG: arsenic efflux protein [Clostridia bacterium]|nr:arsenic efflux protein [Clostridia bacterium]